MENPETLLGTTVAREDRGGLVLQLTSMTASQSAPLKLNDAYCTAKASGRKRGGVSFFSATV